MPGAVIVANQPTGAGPGTPGIARNDLWQARAINLAIGVGGNTSYLWELLDKPPGSAAVLLTPLTAVSGWTPDLTGTYRVRLVTNGGGPGNIQVLVFRVRYTNVGVLANRGWAYPGFGEEETESNYGGNARGWSQPFEYILEDIRVTFTGLVAAAAPRTDIILAAGVLTCGVNAFIRVGCRPVDMSLYPPIVNGLNRVVTFVADIDNPLAAVSAEVRLFDVTHAILVTGTDLTSILAPTTDVTSAALTVGAAAGNVRNDIVTMYEAQLKMNGGVLGVDQVFLTNARLRINYV